MGRTTRVYSETDYTHACDQSDCTERFKRASTLNQHKSDIHDIGVTWHTCDQPDCTERFKTD